MHLGYISTRFQRLSEQRQLGYYVAGPASDEDVLVTEQRLGISLPEQVRLFYRSYNGLRVDEPQLELLPIERLDFVFPHRLHFATLDGGRLFFDTARINEAGQWTIVTEGGDRVTFTVGSFWTMHIWAWVEKRRKIWLGEAAT